MNSTRTFVAIKLLPPAATVVTRLLESLARDVPGVRWTRPTQLHVTIKYLGDVDNTELPKICDTLRAACADIEPFDLTLDGLGTFPKNKPPRVVWAGIGTGREPLQKIHGYLDETLSELGIPREGRAFTPHLTLGRAQRRIDTQALAETLAQAQDKVQSQCDVSKIFLVASLRERGKIVYEPIDTIEL